MVMRHLWGLAIGHTYTWKDQGEGSSFYAKLDNLVQCSIESQGQPAGAKLQAPRPTNPVSLSGGVLTPMFSWTASAQASHSDPNEDGYCNDQIIDDEDWEDDAEGGNPAELEDDWDFRNDEEVITYDDMYRDWYLYGEESMGA
jgi:hypothetical protein